MRLALSWRLPGWRPRSLWSIPPTEAQLNACARDRLRRPQLGLGSGQISPSKVMTHAPRAAANRDGRSMHEQNYGPVDLGMVVASAGISANSAKNGRPAVAMHLRQTHSGLFWLSQA